MRRLWALAFLGGVVGGGLTPYLLSAALAARNSSGTHSLPAGNPVVSGTTISSTTHNNTMSDISTEITDSLSRSGKGAMLAALELINGSVGTPALSFDSDPDTGLYRIGANNPGMSAGNTLVQSWSISGTTLPYGATITQAATNQPAVTATGNGTGPGGQFQGGASNGGGLSATGNGSAVGLLATGGTTGDGLQAVPGTAADATTNAYAATLHNGHLRFSTAVNPNITVSQTNTLTPMNLIKAWGRVAVGNAVALNSGFNVTSVSCASNDVTVTIAGDMANANYAVIVGKGNVAGGGTAAQFTPSVRDMATGTFVIEGFDWAGSAVDLCNAGFNGESVHFMVLGAQ